MDDRCFPFRKRNPVLFMAPPCTDITKQACACPYSDRHQFGKMNYKLIFMKKFKRHIILLCETWQHILPKQRNIWPCKHKYSSDLVVSVNHSGAVLSLLLSIILVHYCDVIMGATASQITSITIVYSTVYSGSDQWKHKSSASLAFVRGIHRWPVNSPHKGPVTRNIFPFHDVIMQLEWIESMKDTLLFHFGGCSSFQTNAFIHRWQVSKLEDEDAIYSKHEKSISKYQIKCSSIKLRRRIFLQCLVYNKAISFLFCYSFDDNNVMYSFNASA